MSKRPEVGGPSESQRLEGRVPGKAEEFGLSSKGWGALEGDKAGVAGPDLFGKPPSGCQKEMEWKE